MIKKQKSSICLFFPNYILKSFIENQSRTPWGPERAENLMHILQILRFMMRANVVKLDIVQTFKATDRIAKRKLSYYFAMQTTKMHFLAFLFAISRHSILLMHIGKRKRSGVF